MPNDATLPDVHWFKMDVSNPANPTVVAEGDITGAAIGSGVATFDGSIAVDSAGDMIINFTASGPDMDPADYYVEDPGNDPTYNFSAPVLYQASTSFYNSGNGKTVQPWGSNSSAVVDPNNPQTFWLSGEYVANGTWQTSLAQVTLGNGSSSPAISSISTSGPGITNGTGDLNAGKTVTLTVNFSEAVTVNTSGDSPTLFLNDNGTASYVGGSGSTALTFNYTVAAGQNTSDLTVSSFNTNGATVQNGTTAANLSDATNYSPAGTLQIDTAPPVVTISNTGGLTNQATQTLDGTADIADAGTTVTVLDSTTQVGTATVQANGTWTTGVTLASGTNTLTAQDTDAAGNTGTSNAVTYTLNTTAPVVTAITTSGPHITNGNGDLNAGKVVTLTVNFSEAVNVTGSPLLVLNDSANASYTTGLGTSALTFTYTVAAGQNTADLTVSLLNLNGGTIRDAASNDADLSGATNYTPAGTLQIDTTPPVVTIANAGGTVTQATQTVTGTVDTVDAGTTVTLLDGTTQVGTATVQANGTWTTDVTLASGTNTLTAQDTDAAGNTGTSNSVTYTLNSTATASPPPPPTATGTVVDWQQGSGGILASWELNGGQIASSTAITYRGSPATPDSSWNVVGIGDFNSDGGPDLLWRNQNGTLVDWTMNGSQIASSQVVTFGGNTVAPDNSWNVAGIGDFNGDGKSDVLWRNTNGSLIDWTMNGSQVTTSQQVTLGGSAAAPDSSWSVAGIGDFNGDGKSDILWRNTNGSLIDWTMNGSQITSSQAVTFGGSAAMPDTSWSIAAIGDFNGDGKSDILWRNTNGSLIDWTMNGSQIANVQQVTFQGSPVTLDSSWQIAQIGDFNGNGTSDILLRNTSSGAMEDWSMNGAQIALASQVTLQGSPATPPVSWNTLSKPTDFFA